MSDSREPGDLHGDLHDPAEVRARLQGLGYLDPGVENLLVREAAAVRPGFGAVLRLAALAALVAGPPLAALAAAGLALANHLSAARVGDLLLLALYVLPLAAALVFLLVVAVAAVVASAARLHLLHDVERAAVAAGVLAGLGAAVGAYVVWRTRGVRWAGESWHAEILAFLGILALFALIVRVGHGAALALGIRYAHRLPQRRVLAGRRFALVLAALALVLAAATAIGMRGRHETAPRPASLPVTPQARPLVVLAVDGWDDESFRFLRARGALPHLGALEARAERWHYARASLSADPPVVWTTVATGFPPRAHGVEAIDAYELAGMRQTLGAPLGLRTYLQRVLAPVGLAERTPVTSRQRRRPTFWEVAGRGLPVLVVNWWATWPVEPLSGRVVSNYAMFELERGGGGGAASAVLPASLVAELTEPLAQARATREGEPAGLFGEALLVDRFHAEVFRRLYRREPLATVYLPGLDIAAAELSERTGAAGTLAASAAVETLYRGIDALVGGIAAGAPDVDWILVADHGRTGAPGGVVWIAGSAAPGLGGECTPLDLAPTILARSGVPLARDLPGRALPFPGDSGSTVPAVPTYGERSEPAAAAGGADAEYLQRLRSLGYLR